MIPSHNDQREKNWGEPCKVADQGLDSGLPRSLRTVVNQPAESGVILNGNIVDQRKPR